MKSVITLTIISGLIVALFTRAWIEIDDAAYSWVNKRVALFTRAWIEIHIKSPLRNKYDESPSSRGRGLKSLTGVENTIGNMSPSSRGRGLK